MIRDRRHGQRISVQQTLAISLGNGGHQINAMSANVSSGGAFIYCDRFLAIASELTVVLELPPEVTPTRRSSRVFCEAKVVRIDPQLKDGNFGVGLAFTKLQHLPEA